MENQSHIIMTILDSAIDPTEKNVGNVKYFVG